MSDTLIYRALARLLDYPGVELVAALPELDAVVAQESRLAQARRDALRRIIAELGTGDLMERQAQHVAAFDRVRTLSLHLFEHVHGDARSRGKAMVDLVELYRRHGFDVTAKELPDYLPLVLEFFSLLPTDVAREHLAETTPILARLQARLARRGSTYVAIFDALLALAAIPIAAIDVADESDEESPEAIDRAWEDAAVTFGGDRPVTEHDRLTQASSGGSR
jgi:nitrate reductase delta subunit